MLFPSIENFKLGLNSNPRCGGIPSAVFLGSTADDRVREYMKNNYERVFPIIMYNIEIPFYFLPENLKKGHLYDCLLYNNPSINIPQEQIFNVVDEFTYRIKKRNNLDLDTCGIALMDFNDPTLIVDYYLIDPNEDISSQLNDWILYLLSKIQLSSSPSGDPMMDKGRVSRVGENIYVDIPTLLKISFSKDLSVRTSDEEFDEEGYKLASEIKERINILKERGFMKLLAEIVDEIQETTAAVSKIHVTRDYRIFLSDWGHREVIMAPLPKTIFILFLNHPEGILFKELVDYKDEITAIYKNITLRENIDDIESSIDALVDPMNNSINEKCSRIRAAFLEVAAPHLALPYYITGKKAEPKKITIDRSLVVIEN